MEPLLHASRIPEEGAFTSFFNRFSSNFSLLSSDSCCRAHEKARDLLLIGVQKLASTGNFSANTVRRNRRSSKQTADCSVIELNEYPYFDGLTDPEVTSIIWGYIKSQMTIADRRWSVQMTNLISNQIRTIWRPIFDRSPMIRSFRKASASKLGHSSVRLGSDGRVNCPSRTSILRSSWQPVDADHTFLCTFEGFGLVAIIA